METRAGDSRFTAVALTLPNFLDAITRKTKILRKLQAFLLGMMVAWTPGLIVLAILLREEAAL